MQLAQTADVGEGFGPVGVEDYALGGDLELGVVVVMTLVEELEIDQADY